MLQPTMPCFFPWCHILGWDSLVRIFVVSPDYGKQYVPVKVFISQQADHPDTDQKVLLTGPVL